MKGLVQEIWTQDWRSSICKNPRIKFCGIIACQEFLSTADGGGVRVSSFSDRETSRSPDWYGRSHRTFVSPYPSEMTWVFYRAKYATNNLPEVRSWKFEYYGGLANAGNAFIEAEPNASAEQLALAVLLEGLAFYAQT